MNPYDLLYSLAAPAAWAYVKSRQARLGKYGRSWPGMHGRFLPGPEQAAQFAGGSLWVHGVSVGEITAARCIVPELTRRLPELPLVVSTITETGQDAAIRHFPDAAHTFFPADWSWNVRRFHEVFNPRVFVLMEAELWPNFLSAAARRGTACFVVNGKVSDRSFPRYRFARPLLKGPLSRLRAVCAQTEVDAERFAALGVPESRVHVTGNCKFDVALEPLEGAAREALRAELGLGAGRRWIVAGSTHAGEEELLLDAFDTLRRMHDDLGLLLCPRHPERFDEVARLTEGRGVRATRTTRPAAAADPEVVVLDQMGVLARAYGVGDVALLGGSFCKVGGHSPIEPAVHGVPVVFGPDMHSQREIHRVFVEAGCGEQITREQLTSELNRLLSDESYRRERGACARSAVDRNRGSGHRAARCIFSHLNASGIAEPASR